MTDTNTHIPKATLEELYNSLQNKTFDDPEIQKAVESLKKIIATALNDEDTAKLATDLQNIHRTASKVVIPLIVHDQPYMAIIMACFAALLGEILLHSNPDKEIAYGMRKLVSMLASPENKHAAIILDAFSEED